jgi:hypothetical protein
MSQHKRDTCPSPTHEKKYLSGNFKKKICLALGESC